MKKCVIILPLLLLNGGCALLGSKEYCEVKFGKVGTVQTELPYYTTGGGLAVAPVAAVPNQVISQPLLAMPANRTCAQLAAESAPIAEPIPSPPRPLRATTTDCTMQRLCDQLDELLRRIPPRKADPMPKDDVD